MLSGELMNKISLYGYDKLLTQKQVKIKLIFLFQMQCIIRIY
jgi:hypothetical protein